MFLVFFAIYVRGWGNPKTRLVPYQITISLTVYFCNLRRGGGGGTVRGVKHSLRQNSADRPICYISHSKCGAERIKMPNLPGEKPPGLFKLKSRKTLNQI